jgi:hypothetical protein
VLQKVVITRVTYSDGGGSVGGGEKGSDMYFFFFFWSRCSVRDVTFCSKRFALLHDLATPFILICVLVIIQRYTSSDRSTCPII